MFNPKSNMSSDQIDLGIETEKSPMATSMRVTTALSEAGIETELIDLHHNSIPAYAKIIEAICKLHKNSRYAVLADSDEEKVKQILDNKGIRVTFIVKRPEGYFWQRQSPATWIIP